MRLGRQWQQCTVSRTGVGRTWCTLRTAPSAALCGPSRAGHCSGQTAQPCTTYVLRAAHSFLIDVALLCSLSAATAPQITTLLWAAYFTNLPQILSSSSQLLQQGIPHVPGACCHALADHNPPCPARPPLTTQLFRHGRYTNFLRGCVSPAHTSCHASCHQGVELIMP